MLETGDIYLIRDFHNTGYDPHYQIVVHKTRSKDLIIVYPTTETAKAKKRCLRDSPHTPIGEDPTTYVEIPKGSCLSLPNHCAVNCDKAFKSSEADRESGMDFKKKGHKLSLVLLQKIVDGVKDSDVVEEYVKEALNL